MTQQRPEQLVIQAVFSQRQGRLSSALRRVAAAGLTEPHSWLTRESKAGDLRISVDASLSAGRISIYAPEGQVNHDHRQKAERIIAAVRSDLRGEPIVVE
jgi:hypothetical protein